MPDTFMDGHEPPLSVAVLTKRLRQILTKTPPLHPTLVEDVVEAVLDTIGSALTQHDARLLGEIIELGRIIANARAEVAELNVSDITGHHLPTATDELDAIVDHTAEATHTILDCCEALDRLADAKGDPRAELAAITTRIYESCGFHDIVGQRISKVVKALKRIEANLLHMSLAVENAGMSPARAPAPSEPLIGDEHLLNGPQIPSSALVQSDIDKLMADFD